MENGINNGVPTAKQHNLRQTGNPHQSKEGWVGKERSKAGDNGLIDQVEKYVG